MTKPDVTSSPDEAIEAMAARWIARRDRGLSEAEETAYRKWLAEDNRHAAAMRRPEKNWAALDQLVAKVPSRAALPDADLLAPRRVRPVGILFPLLGAAAAIAVVLYVRSPQAKPPTVIAGTPSRAVGHSAAVHIEPKRLTLEDGSIIELNAKAEVVVEFSADERRVRLVGGEAYFTVAKNAQRPFVVSTPGLAVRAVGTEFSVGLGQQELSVLVTEGRVRVDAKPAQPGDQPAEARELSTLGAGQQGVVTLGVADGGKGLAEITTRRLNADEIDRALSWRNLQLEFTEMPLDQVVQEFNRYNTRKLAVGDAQTATVRVTGTFRANNVDAFVRLLDFSFGVTAVPGEAGIVLHKTHGR